jgi:hypothetical protein
VLGEFAALVLGVFMGVQVDRWYEDRKEAREERNYLNRLGEDLAEIRQIYDRLGPEIAGETRRAVEALRALEQCVVGAKSEPVFRAVLSDHQYLPSFPAPRSTYEEMIASGAFARLQNVELKAAAADLYTVMEWAQDTVNYQRQDLGRASNILLNELSFTTDESGQLLIRSYDFEALCRNDRVRSALAEVADSRSDWVVMEGFIRERMIALETLLGRELQP